ncbi:MAG: EAL domain-containing protein [Woeseia sp.]|nr:EAL domain-containing protein [Woeseia sp.]
MLLFASKAVRGSAALNDVAREMSLSASYFATPEELAKLMEGPQRRIVVLTDRDICDEVIGQLHSSDEESTVGVLVAADRPKLQSSDKAYLVQKLVSIVNLEWVGTDFNYDRLAASARHCRRRMLKLSSDELHRAFENGEFVIRYQPKVERDPGADWVTREAEALIRWQHPEHGLIGPLEFLPEVEEFDLMPMLTDFVLRKTARQLHEWERQGIALNGCVNMAPSLLTDEHIGDHFAAIVHAVGVDCGRFTFEVVEADLDNTNSPHRKALNSLRDNGFRLSLDDFRIAASSLTTLERLPFDEIKIHASALKRAQQDTVAMHVLAAVTGLAHNLGMSVCAEGVEDQSTFDFLEMIECDKMQGFLISEAVVPDIIQRVYSSKDSSAEVA